MAENNGSTLKVLSWNIDDLDAKNLDERTQGVLEIILKKKPDVVLLQEVIEDSLDVFKNECVGYVQWFLLKIITRSKEFHDIAYF